MYGKGVGMLEKIKKGKRTHFWLLQKGFGAVFFFPLTPVNGQRWSVRRGLGRAPGKGVRRGWKLSQAQASELHSRAAG